MKHTRIMRVVFCVMALVLVFAVSNIALAAGNIDGGEYSMTGTTVYTSVFDLSSAEITTAMSPGGSLYATYSKAVALVNPAPYCTVDRVRCYPLNYTTSPIDLRINPSATSNWVGPGQTNGVKQVKTVQTILYYMGYLSSSSDVDGICGTNTTNAIKNFQATRNLGSDGIVGTNTWRALCSCKYFTYGTSTWGSTT